MRSKTDSEAEAYRILREELTRRDISYKNLSRLLAAQGVMQNEEQLKTRVSRGRFSLHFFLLVLRAIGAELVIADRTSKSIARIKDDTHSAKSEQLNRLKRRIT